MRQSGDQIAKTAGKRVAYKWVTELQRLALGLSDHPEKGQSDDRLGKGRRRLIRSPYWIVYDRDISGTVRIVRIVHGARDLVALFGSDEDNSPD